MKKETIVRKLKANKKVLEKKFHITRIGLFGSYSKSAQHENSDLDLVYELAEGFSLGLSELYELEMYLQKMFEEEKIDLVNKKYMNPVIESEMDKSVIYV